MDIKQALNRIYWRFGGNNNKQPFPVKQEDIDAFDEIAKTIKEHQEQQYKQNELFAKLYIFVYMRFIEKMGATVNDKEPRKAMFKILEKPIEHWVWEFKDAMNDSEMYKTLEDAGIELKHPALGQTKVNETNETHILNSLKEVWSFEMVKECLEVEINNALNLNK